MDIKASSCPSGQVLQKYPSTEGCVFFFFLLENCGPDLRQHAIVEAANTLYPGNRWGERKSTSWCHYEAMWPRCVSKQERRRGSAAGRRERLDPAQDCSSAHISAVMSTITHRFIQNYSTVFATNYGFIDMETDL